MKKYIMPVVGVAAFIVGGLVAREKALDIAETLETVFSKKKSAQPVE